MKRFFESWKWEDTWMSLCFIVVGEIGVLILMALFSDHNVRYYYLSGNTANSIPAIRGDINWGDDITLQLDRDISYTEAIEMVEKLNKTLK